ncbi:hypothetical protein GCM10008941_09810 [Rhizomicrobium palustre]
MPARLKAQAGADPIEARQKILPALSHIFPMEQRRPTRDKAHGVSRRVPIDAKEDVLHGGSLTP